MNLDKHAPAWYSSDMFLLSLVLLGLWAFSRLKRRVQMARYECDYCHRQFVVPYTPDKVYCPNCTPLFQDVEDMEWNFESN